MSRGPDDAPAPPTVEPVDPAGPPARPPGRSLRRSAAAFSLVTALSRVVALVREVVAARYFGVGGRMSAFTIANQLPDQMRALLADSALQGAFIPVFTRLLEEGRRREAIAVASSLFSLLCVVLGSVVAVFLVAAPFVIPLFTPGFADEQELRDLTIHLARIVFPVFLLFAASGLIAGILNSFDHFALPALGPVVWNVVVIASLVFVRPALPADDEIYAYAIGVLAGGAVQFALFLPILRSKGVRLRPTFAWRDPNVKRVLKLMLPVTLTLGLFNFSLLVNSLIGTLVRTEAPAAIERAFRICVLPQGVFTLAISTVLFPTISRLVARGSMDELRRVVAGGMRQVWLLTIASGVLLSVLATPITRLLYERGAFDAEATKLVAAALVIWAMSLPFQGTGILLSQVFFSMQRPWTTTAVAVGYLTVNAAVGIALHGPLGIKGVVTGTVIANVAMAATYAAILRSRLGGLEGGTAVSAVGRMLVAGAALGVVAHFVWLELDRAVGRGLAGEIVSVGTACAAGAAAYAAVALLLRLEEARELRHLIGGLLTRS